VHRTRLAVSAPCPPRVRTVCTAHGGVHTAGHGRTRADTGWTRGGHGACPGWTRCVPVCGAHGCTHPRTKRPRARFIHPSVSGWTRPDTADTADTLNRVRHRVHYRVHLPCPPRVRYRVHYRVHPVCTPCPPHTRLAVCTAHGHGHGPDTVRVHRVHTGSPSHTRDAPSF
jgi:hypothetical protein